MDLQYDNILLEMLMVLFPIISYQAFMNNRKLEDKESFYWGLVFSVTMGLCITFAIKIEEGIILDLRMVPWFLAFIYGGKAVGIFVTLFYVVIRFLVGGIGMIPAFMVLLLGSMFILRFRNQFIKWDRKKKLRLSVFFLVGLSTMIIMAGIVFLKLPLTPSNLFIDIGYVITNAITVWLSVHLMESHKEKQELVKEIQKNEKLQVVGQVAASVAHEIRNPMTSVRGFIQLFSSSKNINAAEKEQLLICLDELDRANEIISDYLSLGKNQELEKPGLIDVSSIATRTVNSLFSYATINNVRVSLEICNGAYVLGNVSRLQQMLVNLIKNAIEAAHPDGNVGITVLIVNQQVKITVSDDGVGMTSQQLENIGLPYYSTKEKGTGLGLMVTLQMIKEMNGNWNVTSYPNKGTQFNISFPIGEKLSRVSLIKGAIHLDGIFFAILVQRENRGDFVPFLE